jgi:hypothetical protein
MRWIGLLDLLNIPLACSVQRAVWHRTRRKKGGNNDEQMSMESPVTHDLKVRAEISNISVEVSDFLGSYVMVHKYVFRTSIRRIIPIFFFQAIRFDEALSTLALIDDGLSICSANALKLSNFANVDQADYLRNLVLYVESLKRTLALLQRLLGRLAEKSRQSRSYGWRAYKEDLANYKMSVDSYLRLGGPLKSKLLRLSV